MSFIHSILFQFMMKQKKYYVPNEPPNYQADREQEKKMGEKCRIPARVSITHKMMQEVPVEIITKEANPKNKVIYYIHGGGFVTGSAVSRRSFTTYLADKLEYNVAAVEYRLAPEHPYPAAPEDCLRVYESLIKQYSAEDIVILGESAGGNLVFSTVLQAKDQGLPLPAAIFAIAPTVQYDQNLKSYMENQHTDCMIANLTEEVCEMYFGTKDDKTIRHPYAAPLYGNMEGLPPVYLFASKSEVLRDDSICMYHALKTAGVQTKLYLRNKMMHTYMIIPSIPEAKKDLQKIKQILDEKFCER